MLLAAINPMIGQVPKRKILILKLFPDNWYINYFQALLYIILILDITIPFMWLVVGYQMLPLVTF